MGQKTAPARAQSSRRGCGGGDEAVGTAPT